jgi:hypothetical protein
MASSSSSPHSLSPSTLADILNVVLDADDQVGWTDGWDSSSLLVHTFNPSEHHLFKYEVSNFSGDVIHMQDPSTHARPVHTLKPLPHCPSPIVCSSSPPSVRRQLWDRRDADAVLGLTRLVEEGFIRY